MPHVGFSDELALSVDESLAFNGSHTFSGFQNEESRGWVRPADCLATHRVDAGQHRLEAIVRLLDPSAGQSP